MLRRCVLRCANKAESKRHFRQNAAQDADGLAWNPDGSRNYLGTWKLIRGQVSAPLRWGAYAVLFSVVMLYILERILLRRTYYKMLQVDRNTAEARRTNPKIRDNERCLGSNSRVIADPDVGKRKGIYEQLDDEGISCTHTITKEYLRQETMREKEHRDWRAKKQGLDKEGWLPWER